MKCDDKRLRRTSDRLAVDMGRFQAIARHCGDGLREQHQCAVDFALAARASRGRIHMLPTKIVVTAVIVAAF